MAKNPSANTTKPDDPAQYQRFLRLAREAVAEGDPKALNEAVKRLARHGQAKPEKPKKAK